MLAEKYNVRKADHYLALPLAKVCHTHSHSFRLRNDLYCVEWGVKLYSLTHSLTHSHSTTFN